MSAFARVIGAAIFLLSLMMWLAIILLVPAALIKFCWLYLVI